MIRDSRRLSPSKTELCAHQDDIDTARSHAESSLKDISLLSLDLLNKQERARLKRTLSKLKESAKDQDPDDLNKSFLKETKVLLGDDKRKTSQGRAELVREIENLKDRLIDENPENILNVIRKLVRKCLCFWGKKYETTQSEKIERICDDLSQLQVLLHKSFSQEDILETMTTSIFACIEECLVQLENPPKKKKSRKKRHRKPELKKKKAKKKKPLTKKRKRKERVEATDHDTDIGLLNDSDLREPENNI
jgi:hypothetical protein